MPACRIRLVPSAQAFALPLLHRAGIYSRWHRRRKPFNLPATLSSPDGSICAKTRTVERQPDHALVLFQAVIGHAEENDVSVVMLDLHQGQVFFGCPLAGVAAGKVVRVHIRSQELRFDAEDLFVMPDSVFKRGRVSWFSRSPM